MRDAIVILGILLAFAVVGTIDGEVERADAHPEIQREQTLTPASTGIPNAYTIDRQTYVRLS